MRFPWQQMKTQDARTAKPVCKVCNNTGMTGWEKPMGFPPVMVFIPQVCTCPIGDEIRRGEFGVGPRDMPMLEAKYHATLENPTAPGGKVMMFHLCDPVTEETYMSLGVPLGRGDWATFIADAVNMARAGSQKHR